MYSLQLTQSPCDAVFRHLMSGNASIMEYEDDHAWKKSLEENATQARDTRRRKLQERGERGDVSASVFSRK
jgi:hypothetical protein